MSNRTYRVTEIVGTSPDGIDQAVRNGVELRQKKQALASSSAAA